MDAQHVQLQTCVPATKHSVETIRSVCEERSTNVLVSCLLSVSFATVEVRIWLREITTRGCKEQKPHGYGHSGKHVRSKVGEDNPKCGGRLLQSTGARTSWTPNAPQRYPKWTRSFTAVMVHNSVCTLEPIFLSIVGLDSCTQLQHT